MPRCFRDLLCENALPPRKMHIDVIYSVGPKLSLKTIHSCSRIDSVAKHYMINVKGILKR